MNSVIDSSNTKLNNISATCTVDEALDYIGFGKFQWILLILSGIGFFSTTVELIMISRIGSSLVSEWGLSDKDLSLFSSLTFLGQILGGIVWGSISDRLGRKPTFLGTALVAAIFACLPVVAPNFPFLITCRFLLGFAIGGSLAIDFIYFVEFVPMNSRAFRTTFIILLGIFAFFYVAAIDFTVTYGWRWFVLICGIPNVLLFFGRLFWKWESPRFLGVNGKPNKAIEVLNTMAKWNGKPEIRQIVIFPFTKQESPSWYSSYVQVFRSKHLMKTLRISMIFFCQAFAYYAWMNWLYKFSASRKIESLSPTLSFLCIGVSQLLGLAGNSFLLGRVGRRVILCLNLLGSAISTAVLLLVDTKPMFLIVSGAVYFFVVGSWTGLYVTTPEQFPTTIRASSMAVVNVFGRIGGIISPTVLGLLWSYKVNLEWIVTLISGLFALAAIISLTSKETKDSRLEDV